ncbi:hypothetical protein [Streptomyces sp. NPDC051677]
MPITQEGWPPTPVAAYITMDVYTHVVGDSEREAVTMLAELLEDPLAG